MLNNGSDAGGDRRTWYLTPSRRIRALERRNGRSTIVVLGMMTCIFVNRLVWETAEAVDASSRSFEDEARITRRGEEDGVTSCGSGPAVGRRQ